MALEKVKLLSLLKIVILLSMTVVTIETFYKIQPVSAQTTKLIVSQFYEFNEPPGTTFLVYINISDVENLNLFVINMSWNPEIIKLTEDPNGLKPAKNTTKYGIYFGYSDGSLNTTYCTFLNTSYCKVDSVSNDGGWIYKLWAARASGGVSGNGTLVILNFTLLQTGTTKIEITGMSNKWPGQAMLIDKYGNEIEHEEVDGIVSDKPPPAPQIWEELWFQVLMGVLVAVIVFAASVSLLIRYKPKPKPKKKKVEEEELDLEL